MKVSVIVPTVDGREDHLERCVRAYQEHAAGGGYELELLIEHNHPSCGAGWQAGAEKCSGDYIHLTDDDIEPRPGWLGPAVEAVDRGFLPAPQVYDPHGHPQSLPVVGWVAPDWTPVEMTALPFFSWQQWQKIQPLFTAHYYSDNFVSYRGDQFGWLTRLRTGYSFIHHWAQVKRGAGMKDEPTRMWHDQKLYEEAKRRVRTGQWSEPWPPNGGLP